MFRVPIVSIIPKNTGRIEINLYIPITISIIIYDLFTDIVLRRSIKRYECSGV